MVVPFDRADDYRVRRVGRKMQIGPMGEPAPHYVIDLRQIS
jgi:hypothetical protein